MIPTMHGSGGDTFFRAVVMGAVLGFVVWAACRYTTIPQQLLQRAIEWHERASAHGGQHTAEIVGVPQPMRGQQAVAVSAPVDPRTGQLATFYNATPIAANPQPSYPNQPASYIPQPPPDPGRDAIEQRLRELGAVYSLLETWGRDAPRYRFHCRVAMAGNAQITRSFERNGKSPHDAMLQVLRAIEAFRAQAGFADPNMR